MAVRRAFVTVLALSLLACSAVSRTAAAQGCGEIVNSSLRAAVLRGDQQALNRLAASPTTRSATSFLCRYEPWMVDNDDSSDAWCEGTTGAGVGEMLAYLQERRVGELPALEIWAGYGKSEALFRANGRPRRVRVWALGLEVITEMCGEEPCPPPEYRNPRPLGSIEMELRDVNGWQPLPVPEQSWTGGNPATLFGIEILSVYPGARYTDTCISGIQLDGSRTRVP